MSNIYLYICVHLKFSNFLFLFIFMFAESCKHSLFFNKLFTFIRDPSYKYNAVFKVGEEEHKHNFFLVKLSVLREFNNSVPSDTKVSLEILLPEETGKSLLPQVKLDKKKVKKINMKYKVITFLYILFCFSCQFLLINLLSEMAFIHDLSSCEKKSGLCHWGLP